MSLKKIDNTGTIRTQAYWESSLFSEIYIKNDLKRDFDNRWDLDYNDDVFDEHGDTVKSGFAYFYKEFRDIANNLRKHKDKKLSETGTIDHIIKPLLRALGWYDNCLNNAELPYAPETSFSIKVEGKKRSKVFRTDMLLVDEPQESSYIMNCSDMDQARKEARNYCLIPLEAKYWNRITDKKGKKKFDPDREDVPSDDSSKSMSFNEQILNYMKILKKKWGVVTDGNTWLLLNSEISGESSERCFEFKIEALLSKEQTIDNGGQDELEFIQNAKIFYLLFGKPSFVKDEKNKIFINELLKESRKYIDAIEEDLKDRFISVMNIICDGFLREAKKNGTMTDNPTKKDLKLIRTVSESHLFNILFIKSCEARGVLPIKSHDYYKMSLTSIIDRIYPFDPEKYIKERDKAYINKKLAENLKENKFNPEGVNLYKNLIKLTEVIHDGATRYNYGFEIKGFRESIFSKNEWSFVKKHQLYDEEMVKILFQLGYSKSDKAMSRNYQQIPYNYFTARQLGSIYESFLEYQLEIAKRKMVYLKKGKYKQWKNLTANVEKDLKGHEPIVGKNQLFFTPNNSERRATGSYYTPEDVVQNIISDCLDDVCTKKDSKEVLKITVCDPAMGSGHFLIGTLNYLTRKYISALESELPSDEIPSLEQAKRKVLSSCIFGVDLNSRAVKLGKMSLWLESAYPGETLENLDNQLFTGNSIVLPTNSRKFNKKYCAFDWKNKIPTDVVLMGNPPWGAALSENTRKIIANSFEIKPNNLNSFEPFLLLINKGLCSKSSFIVPRNFLKGENYLESRKMMIEQISKITDYGVFPGVTQEFVGIESLKRSSDKITVISKKNLDQKPKILDKSDVFTSDKKINLDYSPEIEGFIKDIESKNTTLFDYLAEVDGFGRGLEIGGIGEIGLCPNCDNPMSKPRRQTNNKDCSSCGTNIHLDDFITKYLFSEESEGAYINPGRGILNFDFVRNKKIDKSAFKYVKNKSIFINKGHRIYLPKSIENMKAFLDAKGEHLVTQSVIVLKAKSLIDAKLITLLLNSKLMDEYYKNKYVLGSNLTVALTKTQVHSFPAPKKYNAENVDIFYKEIEVEIEKKGILSDKTQKKLDKFVCKMLKVSSGIQEKKAA